MADCTIYDQILNGDRGRIQSMLKNLGMKDMQGGSDNATPLFTAAKIGNLELVDVFIDAGCDVNLGKAETSKTPFNVACEHGHSFVVHRLIDAGCRTNKRDSNGSTALHLASKSGSFDVAKILIKQLDFDVNAIDQDGNTPLHLAVTNNKQRVLGLLISNGAEVSSRNKKRISPLWKACNLGLVDMTKVLIHEIILHGNRYSLDDADLEQQRSPLYMAVKHQHMEIVKLLLNAGVDVNFPTKWNEKSVMDRFKGESPLLRAITNGNMEMIDLILTAKGCDVNQSFPGQNVTPLHWAVILDGRTTENWSLTDTGEQYSPVVYLRVIQKLLGYKTEVNTYSEVHYTPLHTVAAHGNLPVARMLLDGGALINRPSRFFLKKHNSTTRMARPVDLALLKGQEEMVRLLVEQGAQYSLADWKTIPELEGVLQRKPALLDWLHIHEKDRQT